MYDMKLLSTYNRDAVTEEIVEPKEGETGEFSYLLVKGHINFEGKDALNINIVNSKDEPVYVSQVAGN